MKNILKENMKRFKTKNLNEQNEPYIDNNKLERANDHLERAKFYITNFLKDHPRGVINLLTDPSAFERGKFHLDNGLKNKQLTKYQDLIDDLERLNFGLMNQDP